MDQNSNTRRLLVVIAAVVVVAVAIFVFNRPGEEPDQSTAPSGSPGESTAPSASAPVTYIEPPFLQARVDSGDLPPIEERLPVEPLVVGPGFFLQEEFMDWEDGEYGGDILNGATYHAGYLGLAGSPILRSPGQSTGASVPNVVSAFEVSGDRTTYTFTIREGLRWSDGELVTTEDVLFSWEDLYSNPAANKPFPNNLYPRGDSSKPPAELTVDGDLTFTITFSEPYGWFETDLNSWIFNYDQIFNPAHYLKQFHVDYADPAELAAAVEAAGVADWAALLGSKDLVHFAQGECGALGMPVLTAWVLTECSDTRDVHERNPYYWHVDASGHQLPYADRFVNDIAVSGDAQTNAILAGQLSLATVGETSIDKMPVYQQNADQSNLKVYTTGSFQGGFGIWVGQDFEYDNPDSVWQQLINDPEERFGRALAAAMNPTDVNDTVYFGLGRLPDPNPYDPDLANQLLDELGMDARGSDGFRLGPNGQPFTMRLTWSPGFQDQEAIAELFTEHFQAVGIKTQNELITGDLVNQQGPGNELMLHLQTGSESMDHDGILESYPDGVTLCCHWYAPESWRYFLTNGAEGREPPDYLQELLDLHVQKKTFAVGSTEGSALIDQIWDIMSDNYMFIPTAYRIGVIVADERLHNLPNEGAPNDIDAYVNAEALWFGD